jgi:arsenate reductase (thioredoxin)
MTVCDNAACEIDPTWPGNPIKLHWGFPDPSQIRGSDSDKKAAFVEVMKGLRERLDLLAETC